MLPPNAIHFRNLNRLGRRRTRLLWGRRRRESANCHLHIFEVGEINAIRSRAFVDRLARRREEEEEGRESCGASGSAARRRRRFQAGRCLAGLLGRPQTSGILARPRSVGALSFSSGPEAHAVAWYVIFESQLPSKRTSLSRSLITGCIL